MHRINKRLHRKIRYTYVHGKRRAHRIHKHPATLPLLLFIVLAMVGGALLYFGLKNNAGELTITPNENYIVILNADGHKRTIPTNAKTVGELLTKAHITLAAGDRVEPAQDAPITVDNFLINVYRAAPVTVIDGATVTNTFNAAPTPRTMVTEAGVKLYPEDKVTYSATDNFVTQKSLGNRLVIDRATPITVSIYSGNPVDVRTQAKTVGDWLTSAKIKPTAEDTVKPAESTPITPGLHIELVRNGIHTVTTTEPIPQSVRTIIDTSLSFGSQVVRQEGSPGVKVDTYTVVVENGNEVSRTLLQSIVTVQPVERIIAKGNTVNIPSDKKAVMAAAGVSPNDYAYVDYIFSRESHWNAAALNSSGCGGLGQACPSSKLAAVCSNWQNDPVCQTRFFSGYAGRYDGWAGAYNFWINHHWW